MERFGGGTAFPRVPLHFSHCTVEILMMMIMICDNQNGRRGSVVYHISHTRSDGLRLSLTKIFSSLVIKDVAYEANSKAKTFIRCPRGSSRPRPGLEDNKTDI